MKEYETLGTLTPASNISSQDPIKASILDLPSHLDKLAQHCFILILRYMGDYPNPKGSTEAKAMQELIKLCIENLPLRDEVLTQLCKQTTNNPKRWLIISTLTFRFSYLASGIAMLKG